MGKYTVQALLSHLALFVGAGAILLTVSAPFGLRAFSAVVLCALLATMVTWLAALGTGLAIALENENGAARAMWQNAARWLFKSSGLFAVEYVDMHHARPDDGGPAIFVVNHMHVALLETIAAPLLASPPTLGGSPNHNMGCRVVAACAETAGIRSVFQNLGCIPVERPAAGGNATAVVQRCADVLADGRDVLIFPEGRHNHKKQHWYHLEGLQTGAFLLARRTGRPIVPIAFGPPKTDTDWIASTGLVRPWGGEPIQVQYLPPLWPHRFGTPQEMREATRLALNRALARNAPKVEPPTQSVAMPTHEVAMPTQKVAMRILNMHSQ